MAAHFFETAQAFRAWLAANHDHAGELLVGFRRKGSGRPSITWPEAVDEALCVGWIDGVRRSLGEEGYTIRFTPRRPRGNWSVVNIARAEALAREGRMQPAGLRAFESRGEARSGVYSYEQREPAFAAEMEAAFRAEPTAWAYFQARPAWYRRAATWWVVAAKREATRTKRFDALVEDSRRERTLPHLTRA